MKQRWTKRDKTWTTQFGAQVAQVVQDPETAQWRWTIGDESGTELDATAARVRARLAAQRKQR